MARDAEVRLRLDATQLAAGARRAGAALGALAGKGAGLAAGMRGAAAGATRSAAAIEAAGRSARRAGAGFAAGRASTFTPRRPTGSAALERAGFAPRQVLSGRTGLGVTAGTGFTMRAGVDDRKFTPGRAGPGQVAGLGFTAGRPFDSFARGAAHAEAAASAAGKAGARAGVQTARAGDNAAQSATRWGRAGQRAATGVSRGTSGAVEAMRRFEQASRRAGTAAERAGNQARNSMGKARDSGRAVGGGGFGQMYGLQVAGTQVRMLARGLREASGQTVDVASERQTARAEMRTVVETDAERAMVRGAAREAAAGRGGMVVPINEADFTNAVFAGVASGLKAQAAVNLVPAAANLGLAGQATTAQAQIGLTQLSKFYPEAAFGELADKIAKTQDMFAFPGGLTQLTEGFRGAGAAAQQWRLSLEDQLITQGVFADIGRRGARGGTATRILLASMGQGFARLGMDVARKDDGSFDMVANLRAVQGLGLSEIDMNKIFSRRGSTAITQQLAGLDKHIAGLGDTAGTAASNAAEHADTYDAAMKRLDARTKLLTAELGEGAISVRKNLANLAVGAIDAGLALGEKFPRLVESLGGALEVGGIVATGAGGVLETAVGVNALAQLMGGRLGRVVRGLFAPIRGLWGVLRLGGPLLTVTAGGLARLAPAFGSFVVFAGKAIGMLSVTVGRAVVTTVVSAMAKVGATGGLKAFGAKLGTATVGLGALALVAAAVNLALTSEAAKDKDPRLSAERKAMEERLGRPVSNVGFALRGMPEEILRGLGLGFLADAVGLEDHTTARKLVAADTAAAGPPLITAAAGGPAVAPVIGPQPAPLVTVAAAPAAGPAGPPAAEKAGLNLNQYLDPKAWGQAIPATMAGGVAEGGPALGAGIATTLGEQVNPLMPQSDALTGPLANLTAWGAAIPQTLAEGVALGAPALAASVATAFESAGLAAPVATAAGDAIVQPAPLITAAADAPATAAGGVTVRPAPLVTAAGGEPATAAGTTTVQPAPLVTAAAGGAAAEGATVTAQPAQPAPLVTLAAGGAATEGATFAGGVPSVDTVTAPGYGPQPDLQVPSVPQIGQPGQGDGESVPLLRAAVMELREIARNTKDKPQGSPGRSASRQQNEPTPHALDLFASIGALDSL